MNSRTITRRKPNGKQDAAVPATAAHAPAAADAGQFPHEIAGPKVLQPQLLYRLLKLTNLIMRPFFTHFEGRYHISINEMRILMTLAPMGEAASHELCEATGLHPMNVSRSVAALRRHGRISERRDAANLRRKLLTLTPEGWALYRTLMPHVKSISENLFAPMSALELEFLSKLVGQLIARLETIDAAELIGKGNAPQADTPLPGKRKKASKPARKKAQPRS
ncbi:MAG: MarR family winged helix-turn-helix transcriptional regulator [Alphaproteobacteria bacterium]|nr:MarR family winged helix-turn-helix transcriptional regulator [Alphaproteobacteria bacterium]MBU6472715.1 MarR family winged helix-turn-helix transcriptional regulator [Alphaproteobacteria bacterium]MDE2013401.1 winged helix-turn-helix transcriptional regulator [Alphaproteobacteria bacterium]MDE2074448.1 winged helix-turn-helix transcriptional regulator [Alphaproteobacteria bacterium]MDE2350897.1 winged helix-turn-helix transcriptional regulator [Alphaproteobacteria bacterium]